MRLSIKIIVGTAIVAASVAVASFGASAPAKASEFKNVQDVAATADTDFSSQQGRHRRSSVVRPFPAVDPSRAAYYRPRPSYYRPYYYAAPAGIPYRPVAFRPFDASGPFFGIGFGFGPRHYW